MLRKRVNKFSKKAVLLMVSPVMLGIVGGVNIANAANLVKNPNLSGSRSSLGSLVGNLGRTTSPSYKLSRSEKLLGGIGIGVGIVSVVGTSVGLGLTEKQYAQTEGTYSNIVDRTYYSFFEEREQSMKDLFNQWGVPMPDKYKNPLKGTDKESTEVTNGFSIGKGD